MKTTAPVLCDFLSARPVFQFDVRAVRQRGKEGRDAQCFHREPPIVAIEHFGTMFLCNV